MTGNTLKATLAEVGAEALPTRQASGPPALCPHPGGHQAWQEAQALVGINLWKNLEEAEKLHPLRLMGDGAGAQGQSSLLPGWARVPSVSQFFTCQTGLRRTPCGYWEG